MKKAIKKINKTETPAEKDVRIKALVDGYIAKGGPITKEQLTDEVREWLKKDSAKFYSFTLDYDRSQVLEYRFDVITWQTSAQMFWNKADAEHAKWLADMQSQTTPITPEQAKMLREGDSWYYYNPVIKSISECVKLIAINADQSFGRYFTRSAAQAALDKAKTEAEPVKWCERGRDDVIQEGDEVHHAGCDWRLATYEIGRCAKGVIGDYSGPLDTRYITHEWLVWKACQDAKEPEPTKSLDDFPINKEEPAYSTEISGNAEDLTLQTSLVLNHERGKTPSKLISFSNYKGIIPDRFTLDMKNFNLPVLQGLINKAFVPVFRGQPKEVVTDETQDPEPVKCIMDGDEFCGITPEWQAWKARQDIKESNKEPVAPVEVIPTNASESVKLSNKSDDVSHPSHYTSHPSGVECITITKHMNFCRGNAVKYLWRAGQKGDSIDKEIEDIAKAEEYCRIEKERLIATKGAK